MTETSRYFADENAIGLAKILIREHDRSDVIHPGHPLINEIPRGTADLAWMPIVGERGWIVLTRDPAGSGPGLRNNSRTGNTAFGQSGSAASRTTLRENWQRSSFSTRNACVD